MQVTQAVREPLSIVNIGGIDFQRTPIGLVQKRPTTNADVLRIHAAAAGMTHGQLMMDAHTGECVVSAWGRAERFVGKIRSAIELGNRTVNMGQSKDATHKLTLVDELIPTGALLVADPELANHPAVNLTWYHGAGMAALLTDSQDEYIVRQISEEQFVKAVTCDGAFSENQIKAIAHLGAEKLAAVVGDDADRRTNPWGLVDMFGNVWIWTSSVFDPEKLVNVGSIDNVARVLRGASFFNLSRDARVADRVGVLDPDDCYDFFGVRFVAVPRTPFSWA